MHWLWCMPWFREGHSPCTLKTPYMDLKNSCCIVAATKCKFFPPTQIFILFQWQSKAIPLVASCLPHFWIIFRLACSCSEYAWNICCRMSTNQYSTNNKNKMEAVMVLIKWWLHLQLPMQSMPITTKVVSSKPVHDKVYSIQHYVIKFGSDLRQVGGFLPGTPVSSTMKLTATI